MNYTYLAQSPFSASGRPVIVLAVQPSTRKTANLLANPRVSLLVHDWVSHRPPTLSQPGRSVSPDRGGGSGSGSGSLAELLLGMNTASLSRISTTINGTAELVPAGTEEEAWFKARHVENNTFGDASAFSSSPTTTGGGLWGGLGGEEEDAEGDGGKKCFIEGEEVRVVVVRIRDGRIADWKGSVRDWAVTGEGEQLANGV